MSVSFGLPDLPEGYHGAVHRPPLEPDVAARVRSLLGHKAEIWRRDIHARVASDLPDLFAVAFWGGEAVAHCWAGTSPSGDAGIVGHVFTAEAHRRHGLAGALVSAVAAAFDGGGGRWLQLHTRNEAAARLYGRVGFRPALDGGEKGLLMLRGGDEAGSVDETYHQASGRWRTTLLGPAEYPGACVFLSSVRGEGKLPCLDLDTGVAVQYKLLAALEAQDRGECVVMALLDSQNARPHGIACRRGDEVDIYAPRAGAKAAHLLRAALD